MAIDLLPATFELPFPDFVKETSEWLDGFEWSQEDEPVFHLVRALKAHPRTRGKDADHACAALEALSAKHRAALESLGLDLRYEDDTVAFHRMWERVRFPMGTDPVEAACSLAGTGHIQTHKKRPGRYERFLTVAALLQIQVRQEPILLPVRKVAKHMPCEPKTVSAWIAWAIQDGVLIKTAEHAFRSQGESRAAEYVFALYRWPTALEGLGKLVGLAVRPQDLRWIEDQFSESASGTTAE